jgi:hypothetical protein
VTSTTEARSPTEGRSQRVTEADLQWALEATHKRFPLVGLLDDLDPAWVAYTLMARLRDRKGVEFRWRPIEVETLDVDRLTRVLQAIHGDNVPFPRGVPTTPREYAEKIVEVDARLASDFTPEPSE